MKGGSIYFICVLAKIYLRNIVTNTSVFCSWAFYPGGVVQPYCSSNGNSLHFNGQLVQNSLTTLDLYITSDTFIQFELITSCSADSALPYYIQLEYSTNGGLVWTTVEDNCVAQSNCINRRL